MVPSVIETPVAVTIDNLQDTVFKDNGDLGPPYQTVQDVCVGAVRPGLQGGWTGVDSRPVRSTNREWNPEREEVRAIERGE